TTQPAVTPTPSATGSATPSATPSRSRSAVPTRSPVRTSAPAPSPSTSTPPPPPPDVTAPSVAGVSAYPTQLEPRGCLYGAKTSAISATVSDDRTRPDALRVSFRYTLEGVTSSVGMTSNGQGGFQGTLGPLPAPKDSTRIPVYVTAVDAAGNSTTAASPIYVTLYNYCTPG
ncbi:MAG: serine/threonine protein kinase, partial [Micromonospora sp.]